MDYKQKYEEALSRAKDLHDNHALGKPFIYKTCEDIFPELKSEDERIKRCIGMCLTDSTEQRFEDFNTSLKDCLAWLEKQGEQKHKIQPKFKIGDIIRFKGNETLKGEAEAHKIVGYDNELYVFADGATDLFSEQDLYELVEQKPESGYVDCTEHPEWYGMPSKEQTLAWSEEDEDVINHLLAICAGAKRYRQFAGCLQDDITKYQNWLKSLKDRVQPQPKQEWSKDDKKQLDRAIYMMEQLGMTKSWNDVYSWLKSIKSNHWKPSEQNIKDLEWCAGLVKDKMGIGFHRLQVFIDELKQL